MRPERPAALELRRKLWMQLWADLLRAARDAPAQTPREAPAVETRSRQAAERSAA